MLDWSPHRRPGPPTAAGRAPPELTRAGPARSGTDSDTLVAAAGVPVALLRVRFGSLVYLPEARRVRLVQHEPNLSLS